MYACMNSSLKYPSYFCSFCPKTFRLSQWWHRIANLNNKKQGLYRNANYGSYGRTFPILPEKKITFGDFSYIPFHLRWKKRLLSHPKNISEGLKRALIHSRSHSSKTKHLICSACSKNRKKEKKSFQKKSAEQCSTLIVNSVTKRNFSFTYNYNLGHLWRKSSQILMKIAS